MSFHGEVVLYSRIFFIACDMHQFSIDFNEENLILAPKDLTLFCSFDKIVIKLVYLVQYLFGSFIFFTVDVNIMFLCSVLSTTTAGYFH